jgi:hypothetical protein
VTKVFVSYAREDQGFRDQLIEQLAARGIERWVDEDDIAPAVNWRGEINHGIETTEALVAIVSPHFAASTICGEEVRHADQLGKRILPIVIQEPGSTIPEIGNRNWIFWRSDDEREAALEKVDEALTGDPEWAKKHTSLLTDALEWERHSRERSRLLSGAALAAAESALTIDRRHEQPQPTAVMREHVQSSRIAETKRQRRTAGISLGVATVSIALAVFAFVQFITANTQRTLAEEQLRVATSRALAAQSVQLNAFGNETIGLLLAAEAASSSPTAEARDALLRLLPAEAIAALRSPERSDAAADRVTSLDARFEVIDAGQRVRDVVTGETQTLVNDPEGIYIFLRDVTFSPDSTRLVVTNLNEYSFQVYDLKGGLPTPAPLEQKTTGDGVIGAALGPQNDLLAVSVVDGPDDEDGASPGLRLSVWDEEGNDVLEADVAGELGEKFEIEEALVRLSIDDDLGAFVTVWGEVQLFSARTAQLIGNMLPVECSPGCEAEVYDASDTNATFSATSLESIDVHGTARKFDLDIARWIELACDSTTEQLTREQWDRFVGDKVKYEPVC